MPLLQGLAQLTRGTNVTVNSVLAGPTWTGGVQGYMQGLAKQAGKSSRPHSQHNALYSNCEGIQAYMQG